MEMVKNGQVIYKPEAMMGASEEISTIPSDRWDQVEDDGSFVPASADDVIDVEHLLTEPKTENVLEDDGLCLDSRKEIKCLAVEDFPCPDDYCQIKTENGMMASDTIQEGKQEPKFEFLDGILQGIDEEGNLHITSCLSGDCTDYLLDSEFADRISQLDYGSREGHCLGNLHSENVVQDLSGRDGTAAETSDFQSSVVPLPESLSDRSSFLLDNMTIRELHETFRSTFGRETFVKDKQWLKRRILFGLQNLIDLENGSSLLETGPSSIENEDDLLVTSSYDSSGTMYCSYTYTPGHATPMVGKSAKKETGFNSGVLVTNFSEAGKIGYGHLNSGDRENVLVTQKRLRKPTRRYIEELSDLTSRHSGERLEDHVLNSKDKCLRVKSLSQHHRSVFGTTTLVSRQDSPGVSSVRVAFGHRARRGRPRKNYTTLMGQACKDNKEHRPSVVTERNYGTGSPESDSQDDISDDCVATMRTEKVARRKHHRLWTLSEIMKLIEGVSRYGVGRWTDIKRLLFASSAHRTSVDLKDKWRNLLRASCVQMPSKEAEQRKKHASLPIPQSVLCRVRELAVVYPYPRDRKSRLPRARAATPVSVTSSDRSISRSGRVLHKKNLW